ncbi:MAG: PIN domain-containing protein [Oscillospiraceae bacterium]|nr:PIN domain-containing protein [Oscillospiraceae bacterium]
MNGKAFLDTNILVYLHSSDEPQKQRISMDLLSLYQCCTSVQALNEFCYVGIKKQRRTRAEMEAAIGKIENFCQVNMVTVATITDALRLHEVYGYNFFDCLMLASAIEAECAEILSEDMSDGQIIEQKIKIVNPFKVIP